MLTLTLPPPFLPLSFVAVDISFRYFCSSVKFIHIVDLILIQALVYKVPPLDSFFFIWGLSSSSRAFIKIYILVLVRQASVYSRGLSVLSVSVPLSLLFSQFFPRDML